MLALLLTRIMKVNLELLQQLGHFLGEPFESLEEI